MGYKQKVLWLCTGNSCRSQMAEGLCRSLKGGQIEAHSAGIETHGLNRLAVLVMAELGIDISKHQSKMVTELGEIEFDYVITVCDHASESCPYFPAKTQVIHQGFADPPKLAANTNSEEEALVHYRRVRDQIKEYILTLPAGFGI